MNIIEYVLDSLTSTVAGFYVFFLGGFVLCGIFSILLLTPWFRQMPYRFYASASAAFPVIGPIFILVLARLFSWSDPNARLVFSPIILAFIPSVIALICTIFRKAVSKRPLYVIALSCVILAQLWATIMLWLMTDPDFMGAAC